MDPETSRTQESLLKRPVMYEKERIAVDEGSPSRKNETLRKTASSSLILYTSKYKGSHLETLQQRHLQEKELADRFMRQALNS